MKKFKNKKNRIVRSHLKKKVPKKDIIFYFILYFSGNWKYIFSKIFFIFLGYEIKIRGKKNSFSKRNCQ